ncbi:MAG: hypothetical protein WBH03_15210, partial [Cyclobacteriaceae bacterium]
MRFTTFNYHHISMDKPGKPEIKQEVYKLYDDYAHNRMERREFMERLGAFAVGGLTLGSLMSTVMPNYQDTIQVPEDDPRLDTRFI